MARYVEIDWYDTPRYYDLIFDLDTDKEADFLEAMAERYVRSGRRRVLEPACGSGRLMVEMARRGWTVTGFDLSRPMLDYARGRLAEEGLKGRLVEADMSDFSLRGKFDLAHCLVSTFKYLASEEAASAHLAGVARALAPGGVYVLGFHLTDYNDERKNRERWVARDSEVEVVCNIQGWPADARRRSEEVRSRLVVRARSKSPAEPELRSETCWTFRTYDARQVRRLLRRVPELEHIATFDFTYDLALERELSDDQLDVVLILRRREAPPRDR